MAAQVDRLKLEATHRNKFSTAWNTSPTEMSLTSNLKKKKKEVQDNITTEGKILTS